MIHKSISVDELIKKLKDAKKSVGGNKDVFVEGKPIEDIEIAEKACHIKVKHS